MTAPILTAYAAAFIAIFQIVLMMTVGLSRGKNGIPFGDGGDDIMLRKIRRHGNLTENAPIFLILLALLELTSGPQSAVAGFAGLFIVARLSHAIALSGGPGITRPIGALGTILSIVGTAGTLVYHVGTAT